MPLRRDASRSVLAAFVVLGVSCVLADDDGFKPMAAPTWSRAVSTQERDSPRAFAYGGAPEDRGGGGSFVPKTIPFRRDDVVPKLKRDMLYDRRDVVAYDGNATKLFSRRGDVYRVNSSKEVSTDVWLSNIARALVVLENAITMEDDVIEAEGRGKIGKKYKKYMLPLLLAYKLKFFALIPLMMGGLVLLAGSTGFAGFFFALFAATMGLKTGGHN